MAIRRVKVNTFYEFHVIQEGIERHEVWKADLSSSLARTSCLQFTTCTITRHSSVCYSASIKATQSITHAEQVILHILSQQMTLNAEHDVLEV